MIGRNMSNVNAAGNYQRPAPGGYVMKIDSVKNNPQKEQLEICLEFTGVEFRGYCADTKERFGFWPARCTKSYKEKALPFFKAFIEAVQKSNADTEGLVIGDYEDVDETKLVGKVVGVAVGEREYDGNDGTRKTALDWYNAKFLTVDDIRTGKYEIPGLRVTGTRTQAVEVVGVVDMSPDFTPLSEEDVPF